MGQRTTDQLSLAEALVGAGVGRSETLERIDALMDWEAVGRALSGLRSGERGAPPYPAVKMFKALLLGQWHRLGDPGLEDALRDRLSFRRFVGLGLDESTPDHTTLWRFRESLRLSGLDRSAFEEVNRQLETAGLVVKIGTMIDATVVEAAAQPPSRTREGEPVPSKDADASWSRNKSKGAIVFGYKAHLAVDRLSGIVRRAALTSGSVNETVVADALVMGDERAVYADAAYDTHARRARLRGLGIKDRIMHRPNKHHPELPRWKKARNRCISRLRRPVETAFATLKGAYGWRRVRYFGLGRNATHLLLMLTGMNLRRASALTG